MSLTEEERDTIVSLEIETSKKTSWRSDDMVRLGYFGIEADRYNYACYHALQALLIRNGKFCHTHAGLIAEFGKNFVKTGIFDFFYGRFVSRLEQLREKSDYNRFYEVEEEDVKDIIEPTHNLISIIESMIQLPM